MSRSPIARRYARALFDLAREQGRADAVAADLAALTRLGEHRDDYEALIGPYALKESDRANIWRAMLEGRSDPLTLRFVLFLVHKNRAALLGEIIREYDALHLESQGIQAISVTSAAPLTDAQADEIAARMGRKLGRSVRVKRSVDPSLLGGFVVRAGDTVHDYSVDHQLNRLHHRLISA